MTDRTTNSDFLEGFADHFECVRWKPGNEGFMASCSAEAHDDGTPSLSVDLSEDGDRLLVHCFGGCEVEEVLDALGLTSRNLFASPRNGSWSPRRDPQAAKWERVAERAMEQEWREAQPWYWRYRSSIFEWAGCQLEAQACLVHADLLEVAR